MVVVRFGGDVTPNTEVGLSPEVLARASLILQYVVSKNVEWLEPLGCSVDEYGFKCDFKSLSGEWPDERLVRRLEELAVKADAEGVEIVFEGFSTNELLKLLDHTGVYRVNGVSLYLEPEVKPSGDPIGAVLIKNVSSHNPLPDLSLVRLVGVAFRSREELNAWVEWYNEAVKRDHRLLGQKLDLFSFHDEAGSGLVIYHPKGQVIREELIKLMREVNKRLGYEEVYTPHVYKSILWRISGHYTLYRDKMVLAEVEGEEYGIKPMNCPGHILIYKTRMRSYKDLPIKFAEFGTVYRWEKRGELYGLLRVRGFTQDDGHAFLTEEQVKEEIKAILSEIMYVLSIFGIKANDIRVYLSTRPEKYIGTEEMWGKATEALRNALEELGIPYSVKEGEGAFYGPKIDVHFKDSIGRWWQCSTIQVDFALPERFGLEYIDKDNSRKRPVVIHRAILGSIERFMAIMIEEFEGKLPTWLSPVQVVVIPITKEVQQYADEVYRVLDEEGVRVIKDYEDETLQKKVRKAYDQAIPYIVIVGRKEAENRTVSVRGRGNIQVSNVPLELFVNELKNEIRERAVTQKALEVLKAKVGTQ